MGGNDMSTVLGLQNGSDIRGVAISHEEFQANLTEKEVKLIGTGIFGLVKASQKN